VSKRAALVALAALLLTACPRDDSTVSGASPTASPPTSVASPTPDVPIVGTVTIAQDGCSLKLDGPVAAGELAFVVENRTDGLAAANVAELVGGTFDDLERHVRKEVRLAEDGEAGLGHPDFAVPQFEVLVDAEATATMSGALHAGTYALTCARIFAAVADLRPLAALGPVEVG
jgi:hypothetical protein